MNKIVVILTLASGFAASGCAGFSEPKLNPSAERKAALTNCVSNFLGQDVSPVDSLHICSQVYSRWEPTTTGAVSGRVGARKR